ncbi:unnamed protein product [Pylaiella littoralis]
MAFNEMLAEETWTETTASKGWSNRSIEAHVYYGAHCTAPDRLKWEMIIGSEIRVNVEMMRAGTTSLAVAGSTLSFYSLGGMPIVNRVERLYGFEHIVGRKAQHPYLSR